MERNKPFKPADAILTADWHLREDSPICRTDDWMVVMESKLAFISALQVKHNCPILNSGDTFDFWKTSPALLSFAFKHLPQNIWTVIGNHDMPQHSLENMWKSGLETLSIANRIKIIEGTHWGEDLVGFEFKGRNVALWHTMTWQGTKPWNECTSPRSATLLRKNKQFDLIVTGHNHKTFVEEHEGRYLVNPGSIFRLTADQKEHKPVVFLYYADTNTVQEVEIPHSSNVISSEHIDIKKERTDRIDAFISTLDTEWEAEMSFEQNVDMYVQKNKVDKQVVKIIYTALENGKISK